MITAEEKKELMEEEDSVSVYWKKMTPEEREQMEQENIEICKRWCRYE
jgi:hypothetical protein